MSVQKVTERYRCSDGREFQDKPEADRHENLIKAKDEFEKALARYNIALVQSCKTADGKHFELGKTVRFFEIALPY